MQEVGAYHWLKFIRDATDAADSPKTAAEINLERKKAIIISAGSEMSS